VVCSGRPAKRIERCRPDCANTGYDNDERKKLNGMRGLRRGRKALKGMNAYSRSVKSNGKGGGTSRGGKIRRQRYPRPK